MSEARRWTLAGALGSLVVAAAAAHAADGVYIRSVQPGKSRIGLEVASTTLRRPDGAGPAIVLVGACHVGEKSFYKDLQGVLAAHDVVLYEAVRPPGTGGAGGATDDERVASTRSAMQFVASLAALHRVKREALPADLEALVAFAATLDDPHAPRFLDAALVDAWGHRISFEATCDDAVVRSLGADAAPGGEGAAADLVEPVPAEPAGWLARGRSDGGIQSSLAKALGLAFQLDAMDYDQPSFRSSDLAMDQVQRALDAEGADLEVIETLAGTSLLGDVATLMLRLIQVADVFLDGAIADTVKVVLIEMMGDPEMMEMSLDQMGPGLNKVIVGDRNQKVVDDVKVILEREPTVKSIAIFYGAAHMPDLARRLSEQLGYEASGEVAWHTAFEVDMKRSAAGEADLKRMRRMVRIQMKAATRAASRAGPPRR